MITKEKIKRHNFHFVLNRKMKDKISKLSEKLKLSKSNTVVYILNEELCVLNKYQFDLQENTENLNYQKIDWNSDLHIYMEKNLYRKIKHLADTVFSFSVAIIVRKLIELYFKMLGKCNGKIERVTKVFTRFYLMKVKKYGNILKNWDKNIENEQLCGKFYCYVRLNDKFTITGFKFKE
jgi:hypothetical protein